MHSFAVERSRRTLAPPACAPFPSVRAVPSIYLFRLFAALGRALGGLPFVGDIRGRGFIAGVELVACTRAMSKGTETLKVRASARALSPPAKCVC